MKNLLCKKKYSGILWAIVIASGFIAISLVGIQFFSGTAWFVFSSILRLTFGFLVLYVIAKLYDTPPQKVLSINASKEALVAGIGFLVFFLYYLVLWCVGIKSITGLTSCVLLSRIVFQQITTGFYEELNFRFLVLEGYFYGTQNVKNKLLYSLVSFLLFGAVHVVDGWSTSRFLLTGMIGFSFAVMYLKSRNIVVPMILHFIYDVLANLTYYAEWSNSSLFICMDSISDIILIIMFAISVIMLFVNTKKITEI